ncbi:MAG: BatD family protein [Chitinophagales bacterium]
MRGSIWTSILVLFCMPVFGQASFDATVTKTEIGVSERFQLTLTFNGSNGKDFRPPAMGDFYVLGGPNQSSSVRIINGQMSQSVSYSYVLQAKNIGTFTIGSAYIKSGSETLSTKPISIHVVDKPSSTQGSQNNNNAGSTTDNSGTQDINDYIRDNMFIKTEVGNTDIYKGQDVSVTLKLYKKRNSSIYGYRILQAVKAPKYDGFYAQDIALSDQQPTLETYNGATWEVITIKKTILTAQRSGQLEIDPITLDVLVGVKVKKQKKNNSGDPFQDMWDDFFNDPFGSNQEVHYALSSGSYKVNVRDLPANAPADFIGAVGKFSMQSSINATTTKTDEPLTYKITISGEGNLELFNAPVLNLPPGWETYDPKPTQNGKSITYEYLLIPRSPGDFTIPAYTFSYFDPSKKQYQTIGSDAYPVHVEAGPGYNPSINNYGTNREDVEMLAEDIRFIKKDTPHYSNGGSSFFGSPFFYGALVLPFLAGIGVFAATARMKKLYSDMVSLRSSKANSMAKKRLAKANGLAQQNDAKAFYDETIRAVWDYLSFKLNIPKSELSKENIEEVLLRAQVPQSSAHATLELLQKCEMALFAPQLVPEAPISIYQTATELITKLENEIKQG